MSIYDKASLVQIPSGVKSGTLYNVVPNTADGDFDFTRGSSATRVNKDGLIETVASGVPRLDYPLLDGVVQDCPALLLEPVRGNFATYSSDISSWSSSFSPTITTNIAVAPDGSNSADGIQDPTGGSFKRITRTISVSGNSTYTGSVFVKKETSETAYGGMMLDFINGTRKSTWVIFDAVNGTANNTTNSTITPTIKIEDFGDYWRFSVTATDTGSNTSLIFGYFATMSTASSGSLTAGIGSVRTIWGLQLEQGSYPTSYIPTSGSAVTRTVDSCEIASGLENIIGQTEGTLFIDFEYLYETTTDSSTDVNRDILVLGTASDISEGVSIDNYRSQFRVFVQGSGMTTQSIGNNSTGASQPNTRYKLAVKYKTGDCKAYLNGSLLGSSTGTVSFATNLDGIFFSYNSGSRPYKNQKKVYQLMIFNEALSGSELETITSYKSFGQMAKALLYTIE